MLAAVFEDLFAEFLWICVQLVGAASVVGFSTTRALLCRLDVLTVHTCVARVWVTQRPGFVFQGIGGQLRTLSAAGFVLQPK